VQWKVILCNDQYLVVSSSNYVNGQTGRQLDVLETYMTCWSPGAGEDSFRGVKVAISTRSESDGDIDSDRGGSDGDGLGLD
jgi:hypothetical protein